VIVALPAATPVTTPPPDVTVAIDVLLLVHDVPVSELVRLMVEPIHTGVLPPMLFAPPPTIIEVVFQQVALVE
jgi:hypothetical protein